MALFKPSDFTEIAQLVGVLYEQAEQDVIAMIAKNAKKHGSENQDQWLRTQQAYIKQNQEMVQRILQAYQAEGAKVLNRLPVQMYLAGIMSADQDLLDKGQIEDYEVVDISLDVKGANDIATMGQFGLIHAGAINALASAYLGSLNNAVLQVVRNSNDVFKKIITQSTSTALLGQETRLQATQKAINQFLAHGVGGFTDKAGRKWNLSTYAQMATRTLITNAHNQGKANRYTEFGKDLVIVSQHQRSCPLCSPWERKVLSLSGKHPEYPAFDTAKGAGLFHPNCGHTFTTYIPGLTITDDYEPTDPQGYEDQQRLRELERRMRKAKKQLATAVTPEQKKKAQDRINALSGQIDFHCDITGIPRKRSNEKTPKAQVVKKIDILSKGNGTGGKGSTTGATGSAGKTQSTGKTSKPKEEPKKDTEDRTQTEAYKRMMARKEELKKKKEAEEKAKKDREFEFDISKMTADDLPEALRKKFIDLTARGGLQGTGFAGDYNVTNPLLGYTTVDKLFGDIAKRFDSTDVTDLANAFQMYLTGQHIATKHKFAWTKEEFDKAYGGDSTGVGGFNMGGIEIWYNPKSTALIDKLLTNKKLPTDPIELRESVFALSVIVHEQIHSIRYNSKDHIYNQINNKYGTRWLEEGMTQFLTLHTTESFLKFAGFLDDADNVKIFNNYKDTFLSDTVYRKETGTIGLLSYVMGQSLGVSEEQVVTGLVNLKNNTTVGPNELATSLSKLFDVTTSKAKYALEQFTRAIETREPDTDIYIKLFKNLGIDKTIIAKVEVALETFDGDAMSAYLGLRALMK